MPDITMCANRECPLRVMCYRYRAIPAARQSFAIFNPTTSNHGEIECDHFAMVGQETNLIPVEEMDDD